MASAELRTVLSPLLFYEDPTEEKDERILNRAIWIWITAKTYVRLHEEDDEESTVDDRHERQFSLYLRDTHEHYLSIHAATLQESIICLDYLVGLQDTHFQAMVLGYKDLGSLHLCPFGANILEKIFQNSARQIRFNYMIFTAEQCRTLATSGTNTNIEFFCCQFQDEGAAYLEVSAARQDETSGPAKLRLVGDLLFNGGNRFLFFSQLRLDSLAFSYVEFDEVSCRALATVKVRCLTFGDECELEDGGVALVESVRQGRGPKELFFSYDHPFDSPERIVTFMNALRGNTNLERLEPPLIDDRQVTQALVAALRENKGLVHLELDFSVYDKSDWTELLGSISFHPLLRSLNLNLHHVLHLDIDAKKRCEVTKVVADMLSVNERIEVMSFHNDTFDKDCWDAYVSPRLECNLHRKWLPSIQKIEETSTRAAVLARALAKFSSKPHLVWMLLNQNHDVVSSYLDSTNDLNSIPSRKRSRSPSSEGMSVH
jgi:hypothetical protein